MYHYRLIEELPSSGGGGALSAAVSATLGALTSSSVATVTDAANASTTLSALASSTTATVRDQASASATLAAATASATATALDQATAAVTLGIVTAGSFGLLISTANLRLPINCVLMGQQLYEKTGRTFEKMPGRSGTRVRARSSSLHQLGESPSFSVTSNAKGYD